MGRRKNTKNSKSPVPLPPYDNLKVKEVAAFLGLPLLAVYEMVEMGGIPAFRVGHQIRISRQAFLAWCAAQGGGGEGEKVC